MRGTAVPEAPMNEHCQVFGREDQIDGDSPDASIRPESNSMPPESTSQ